MISKNHNSRIFTKEGATAEILKEVIISIPAKTEVYLIGGGARNTIYFDIFRKPLPQRDYDLLLIGSLDKFVNNLRKNHKFIYGKIRRKDEIVLKKKLVPNPQSITDYLVLDIHRSHEENVLKNLEKNSAFTINGFAIPLQYYFSRNFKRYLIELPGAVNDLKNHRLVLTTVGYKGHPGNLFACLRFMSIGFMPPDKESMVLLLKQLPKLEKWRFERNVKKVFGYTGGEKRARQLAKKLGVKIDIFNFEKLKEFAAESKITNRQRKT
ncbi:MAG: hypothetical protein HYV34_01795 [Candidatus Kerfeldbacteria bacterium]|nr:hypothetical protein [Candidatus Kerfeldbacteria bacterium]